MYRYCNLSENLIPCNLHGILSFAWLLLPGYPFTRRGQEFSSIIILLSRILALESWFLVPGSVTKHEWELLITNSSHSTSDNRSCLLRQITVIVAGCTGWSEISRRQPLAFRRCLLRHHLPAVHSVFPKENLPGRSVFRHLVGLHLRRSARLRGKTIPVKDRICFQIGLLKPKFRHTFLSWDPTGERTTSELQGFDGITRGESCYPFFGLFWCADPETCKTSFESQLRNPRWFHIAKAAFYRSPGISNVQNRAWDIKLFPSELWTGFSPELLTIVNNLA